MFACLKNADLSLVAEHADERQRGQQALIAEFGGRLLLEECGVVVLDGHRVFADLFALHLVVVGIAEMHPDDVCASTTRL